MKYNKLDVVVIDTDNIDIVESIFYNPEFLSTYINAKPLKKETFDARTNTYGNIAYIIDIIGEYVFACMGNYCKAFLARFKKEDIIQYVPDGEYDGRFYIDNNIYHDIWLNCDCTVKAGKVLKLHDNKVFLIDGPTEYIQGNRIFGLSPITVKRIKSSTIWATPGDLDLDESLFY